MSEEITVKITKRRHIAAVNAAWIAGMPNTEEGRAEYPATAEEWLQRVIEGACESYRDHYRSDAITSAAFILRFQPDELATIRAAAAQDQQLGVWMQRVQSEPLVWLGSDEVQMARQALVAAGLLRPERPEVIFAYDIPRPLTMED
jgi:hypothetical protein